MTSSPISNRFEAPSAGASKLAAAWLALAALGAGHVCGQWQTITTRDGLPHDDVLALRVAGENVWVGTAGGLARWDGASWRRWTAGEGLPWPAISAIDVVPRRGEVWLGTRGGGLLRLAGGRFDRFDQLNSGLAGNLVFAVAVEDHLVWAATNGGLSVFDTLHDRWDLHLERRADSETAVTALALDDGGLWAAAWCEPLRRLEPRLRTWSVPAGPAPASALTVSDGTVWWATPRELVRMRRGSAPQTVGIPGSGPAPRLVTCLAVGGDGAVAVGTDRGLEVLANPSAAEWVRHGRAASGGLPDERIRCAAFQGDVLWVGTGGGLARGAARGPAAPPGRDASAEGPALPDPSVPIVRIGLLRPGARSISLPGASPPVGEMDQMAVHLAIEEANAAGGYRGIAPFGFSTGPEGAFIGWGWTLPEDDFPALAGQGDVWGIVGSLGPDRRVATWVAMQAEIPLVNCAPTPATVDERVNPWIFRAPAAVAAGDEERFAARYAARFRRPPPAQAHRLYLTVRHLLEAIDAAGLDRRAIRATLRDMEGGTDAPRDLP